MKNKYILFLFALCFANCATMNFKYDNSTKSSYKSFFYKKNFIYKAIEEKPSIHFEDLCKDGKWHTITTKSNLLTFFVDVMDLPMRAFLSYTTGIGIFMFLDVWGIQKVEVHCSEQYEKPNIYRVEERTEPKVYIIF
jgi:hypothetical protein